MNNQEDVIGLGHDTIQLQQMWRGKQGLHAAGYSKPSYASSNARKTPTYLAKLTQKEDRLNHPPERRASSRLPV